MLEGHISKAFDGDLGALHLRVLAMGGLVLDQVREAGRAYTEWELPAATLVIERASAVSAYETIISEDQFTLIARRAPVASDLRAIIALSKAASGLARAGSEARKIARTVVQQGGRPARSTVSDARHLAELATTRLRSALESLDRLDATLAAEVIGRDPELDDEYAAGLRRLMSRAMEDPRNFEMALEAAFVLKSLERIGDHACEVATQVLALQPQSSHSQPAPGMQAPTSPSASAGPP
jgi:phosphate transport system protein